MRVARLVAVAWLAVPAALLAPRAAAQEVPAPPAGASGNAVEVGVGAGWLHGWDGIPSVRGRNRAARSGAGIELEPSLRVLPQLAVGVYGFGADLGATAAVPATARVLQAGAGVQGTWHFRPAAPSYDPWLSVGAGWRGQWVDYEGLAYPAERTTAQHGADLVRARAGLELRVSPTVALSPEIGASLATILTEEMQGGGWHGPGRFVVGTFVFAGIRATVDIPLNTPPAGASSIP